MSKIEEAAIEYDRIEDGTTLRSKRPREHDSPVNNDGTDHYSKRFRDGDRSDEVESVHTEVDGYTEGSTNGVDDGKSRSRWKAHQIVEDYIDFASHMMLLPTSQLGPYGYDTSRRQFPLETVSALAFVASPLRRPTVVERWSPYEIAIFEGAMAQYGKDFYHIHKFIKTKSTQEIIDFYYVWKKTSHYRLWKKTYIPEIGRAHV